MGNITPDAKGTCPGPGQFADPFGEEPSRDHDLHFGEPRKVEAGAERLAALNPGIEIRAFPERLTEASAATRITG